MKFKSYFILGLVAMMAATACKKTSTPKPGTTGSTGSTGNTGPTTVQMDTDVYVVGSTMVGLNSVAAFWKNGVMTKVSDPTRFCQGTAIAVSGSDVYVAGNDIAGTTTASCWKNAQAPVPLTAIAAHGAMHASIIHGAIHAAAVGVSTSASGIGVNSNGVYIVGLVQDGGGQHAAYWLNSGGAHYLVPSGQPGDNSSRATGIAISGTDFYIVGDTATRAVYWKNGGIATALTTDDNSVATAIAVNGTNVYATGRVATAASSFMPFAVVWNGIGTGHPLPGGTFAYQGNAIAVNSNGDVFVAGYDNAGSGQIATYWRNGVVDKTLTSGELTGIALAGDNDVFVTGRTDADGYAYWKNGVKKATLTDASDVAGVIVVIHPH